RLSRTASQRPPCSTLALHDALPISAPGLLGNDSDVDSASITAVLIAGPTHGTLTMAANGSFTYTPAANYNGPDSFTYRANDGSLDQKSNVGTPATTGARVAPYAGKE